jgi:glycine cleavage system H lipoate-binding protein/ABC-type phosphate transport system substrate-binding protein
MKNISSLIIGLSLLFFCMTGLCNGSTDNPTGGQSNASAANTLSIMSSPELNSLTTIWASEYGKLNPSIKITIANISGNQANANSQLSFISDEFPEAIGDGRNWKMMVGRNAIVPFVNAKNPMLNEIYRQGISAEKFTQLFTEPGKQNWKSMINGGQNEAIKCYIIDNESVKSNITDFTRANSKATTNSNSAAINCTPIATATEIISAIDKDIYAIGLCRLTDVRDASTNGIMQNIKLLPIDKNGNGRIDNFENIYENMDTFTRGVWIGKYPKALCGSIYAVSSNKPTDKNTLAFLTWVTTDGQKFLNQNGYSILVSTEVKSNIDALSNPEIIQTQGSNKPFISSAWMIILIGLAVIGLIVTIVFRYMRNQITIESNENIEIIPALNENSVLAPKGVYFDKTHTWAFMEKDGNVKIGVDDFLQHITGTLTRINMKEPGETIRKGEKILTIMRDGKQLNIYAPISGIIKEQNQILKSDSSLINSSPYAEGWVYLIEPKNWVREIQFMFMSEKYKEWLEDEFSRLKDFFSLSVKSNTAVYAHIIIQDGGELTDNVLADLGPEVWEDFQTKFIDTSR